MSEIFHNVAQQESFKGIIRPFSKAFIRRRRSKAFIVDTLNASSELSSAL